MTSQSLTSDKNQTKAPNRAKFTALFGFQAKQFWTTTLLFTIILFFILPIPMLMSISDADPTTIQDIENLRSNTERDWVPIIRYFVVIAMSLFSVTTAAARFKYLNSKVAVDFFHALPVKRSRLFLTQIAVGALSLCIAYLFNIIITMIIMASNSILSSVILMQILKMTAEVIAYTAVFGALATLVAMISGLTAVQLILSAVAVFIVPVVYIVTLLFIKLFNEHMWIDYYTQQPMFEKMSPALRFLFNSDFLKPWELIVMLLTAAGIFAFAYFVYMKRRSERSGTPVVFKPLGEAIKYILVFVGTLCGGLLFYLIMSESLAWTVFGMICGMVLTFMLTNTILNKTAKAMFKGWRGLLIFGGAAAISFIILATNAFGVNTNIPSPFATRYVEVSLGIETALMKFEDKENIEAVYKLYRDSFKDYKDYERDDYYYSDQMYMELIIHPTVGIPTAKSFTVLNKSDFIEEFRTILDSEEFKEQYAESITGTFYRDTDRYINLDLGNCSYDTELGMLIGVDDYYGRQIRQGENRDELLRTYGIDKLISDIKNADFDYFQQPKLGSASVNIYNSLDGYTSVPIFASNTELQEHYKENSMIQSTYDETIYALSEMIENVEIYHINEEAPMVITDKEEIREILSATSSLYADSYDASPFTFCDYTYNIVYQLTYSNQPREEVRVNANGTVTTTMYDYESADVITENASVKDFHLSFIQGKVPQFVSEYFE